MYITESMNLLHGSYDIHEIYHAPTLRYVFIAITALFVFFLGPTHIAVVPIPLLSSLGTIALLYFMLQRLYGEKIALLASFFLAIFPLDIFYSTILEADMLVVFLMILCYYIHAFYKSTLMYISIGLILGLGIFIKFFILLIIPVILFDIFKTKISIMKYTLSLFLGILIASSPFLLFQYYETGNLFYHISKDKLLAQEYRENHLDEEQSFVSYFLTPFSTYPQQSLIHFYFFFVLALFCFHISFSETRFFIFWFWLFLSYFLLEFTALIPAVQRYILFIKIPLVLFSALLFDKIEHRKYLLFALLASLLFSFYQLGPIAPHFDPKESSVEEVYASVLRDHPFTDVYVMHNNQVAYLTYYLDYRFNYSGLFGYHGPANYTFYDLHFLHSLDEAEGDTYVLFWHRYFLQGNDFGNYYGSRNVSFDYIPTFNNWIVVPSHWILLYQRALLEDPNSLRGEVYYIPHSNETITQFP